jgi:hypothetical protein
VSVDDKRRCYGCAHIVVVVVSGEWCVVMSVWSLAQYETIAHIRWSRTVVRNTAQMFLLGLVSEAAALTAAEFAGRGSGSCCT